MRVARGYQVGEDNCDKVRYSQDLVINSKIVNFGRKYDNECKEQGTLVTTNDENNSRDIKKHKLVEHIINTC